MSSEERREETECGACRICTVGGCEEKETGSAGGPTASLPDVVVVAMGDMARRDPMVSARPRLYVAVVVVVDASLVCREWAPALRRPWGGFEIAALLWWWCDEYGGDRKRCCVFGGGAAC